MDIKNLQVPVTKQVAEEDEDGKVTYKTVTELEPFNPTGKQSDGSQYTIPEKLTDDNHEHQFNLAKPTDRQVICECGFGGDVFPHNAVIKDGHIYDLAGNKIV